MALTGAVVFTPPTTRDTPATMTLQSAAVETYIQGAPLSDAYYGDKANWDKVLVFYRSDSSNQKAYVVFNADGITDPSAEFSISATSVGDFLVEYIAIRDRDGGVIHVYKGDLTTAEFDVVIAAAFSDTSSYLFEEQYINPNNGNFGGTYSMEAWFKYDVSLGAPANVCHIMGGGAGSVFIGYNTGGYLSIVNDSAQAIHIDQTQIPSHDVTDGNWHHCVYVSTGSAAKLYLNNEELTLSGTPIQSGFFGTRIGATYGVTRNPRGYISQANWWDAALTAGEISELYNTGLGPIDPTTHTTRSTDIYSSFSMGDHGSDSPTSLWDSGQGTAHAVVGAALTVGGGVV